jgi:hypothetical protein
VSKAMSKANINKKMFAKLMWLEASKAQSHLHETSLINEISLSLPTKSLNNIFQLFQLYSNFQNLFSTLKFDANFPLNK